jgi:cbb3-type cytochrome oxidase maturation protein
MSVIFIVLPLATGLAAVALIAFTWAVRGGQFDDLDTPAVRMVVEDDEIRKS